MYVVLKINVLFGIVCLVDCDKPLYLTPLLSAGRYEEAQSLAKVDSELFLGVSSYSGLLTVNASLNSHIFFWFFPVDEKDPNESYKQKPLVLWLNGGPSQSSLMGVFLENGPFLVDEQDNLSIKYNNLSWHSYFNMLYIDQPVGTGFSYTKDNKGFVTNMSDMADQLHQSLMQFFQLFPKIRTAPFYIAGESFAGKYIPAIAYKIDEENDKNDIDSRINLQGVAMGNALTDPKNMLNYADFAYQLGFIDDSERIHMHTLQEAARQSRPQDFFNKSQEIIGYFLRKTNMEVSVYNVLKENVDFNTFVDFVNQKEIKNALHVPDMEFNHGNETVRTHLLPDIGVSAMPWLEALLDKGLRVLYFSGNLDFIVGYPLSVNAFKKMNWSGSDDYLAAKRHVFRVNGALAGFVKRANNFAEAVVLNAGHSVTADQPFAALKLMRLFVANIL